MRPRRHGDTETQRGAAGVLRLRARTARSLASFVPPCLRVPVVALLGASLCLPCLPGCDTAGADLHDMFGNLTPPSPGEAARMAADMTDPDRRREGIVLLSNAPWGGTEPYLALYREYAAHDTDPMVRAVSVRALARWGTSEDALIVAANLANENIQVRWEAAKGLQRLHNDEVVTAMLATLRNEEGETDVRTAVARGLGQYAQDRVFHALVAALDARELEINFAARESLVTLTGRDEGLSPAPWLRWYRGIVADRADLFANRLEYVYPTYHRKITVLERIAFWSTPVWEQPAPPAGMRSTSTRTTYGEDDEQQ